ncbi:MAG: type I DNA topoisomerase [Oscillospiraceae bacterium]|nr:type I DNA topoisomerase [Oscillospiraceae bacterium]
MSKLVIVESPAKAKTIGKYLGKDFKVIASVGHIRDLPKSKLGVDVEHDFAPLYENKKDKANVIKELKSKAKACNEVFLATDPDREGEAIAWHLANILGLDESIPNRVIFNEITKSGVKTGMTNPRSLDMDLINAQQARRILDRLLGYKLSPFLWKKVRRGLSAGRVQSVAVRIIVDREKEIEAFKSCEYWSVDAKFAKSDNAPANQFDAKLSEIDGIKVDTGEKCTLTTKEQTDSIINTLKTAEFEIIKVKKSKRKKQPQPPFTTSTMQQEASGKLSYSSMRTMRVAQDLYEGINVHGYGTLGLITYMRTDSIRISAEAADSAAQVIEKEFGKEYLPEKPHFFKGKKATATNAQDAHEAIRPTMPEITPKDAKSSLSSDQYKLYKLVWERFMASQMASAIHDTVSIDIDAVNTTPSLRFRASGYTVAFDGFTRLYPDKEKGEKLPILNDGDRLTAKEMIGNQHFTQPPPRYTEASLIKALEENGIGRPSTYAPTITTIVDRQYVEKNQRQLRPTVLGRVTTDLFEEHFTDIVDTKFTAQMEGDLDSIEDGNCEWVEVLRKFYGKFESTLSQAETAMDGKRVKIPDEPTDEVCDECGKPMVIKLGRFGKFMSCSGFPDCKGTKRIVNETGGNCPKCGKKMLSKKSKKGKTYFGCEDYTDCNYMTWDTPVPEKCPKCDSTMFKKNGKTQKPYCAKIGCENCEISENVNKPATKK